MDLLHNQLDTCTTLTRRVENLKQDKIAQALEITKLKHRVKKLKMKNKLKVSKLRRLKRVGNAQRVDTSDDTVMDDVSKQERIIADMDADVDVTLKDVADIAKEVVADAEIEEGIDVHGRQVESQAQIYKIDLKHADKPNPKAKGKGILVKEPKPLKKQAQIEQDEALARELEAELNKTINWDDVIDQVQRKEKEDNAVMRQKKQKLDEKVAELKRHLQIVPNDYDDVYTEATPLARKVPVVDYEIYTENNKPYYKIIRADGSPQLFLSFLILLRNFDREDLEVLWELVKERFASSKPKNFSDDFLLTTLTYMFEKPDVQAQVWKNQRTVHGLAKVKSWRLLESCGVHIITFTSTHMILVVERRYPLTSGGPTERKVRGAKFVLTTRHIFVLVIGFLWKGQGRTGRAGKSGLATAFFNDNNSSMARPLSDLMQEANQQVPAWLARYAARASYGGGKNRRGGGRFGGRVFRSDSNYNRGGGDGGGDYYGGGNMNNAYGGQGGYGGGYGAPGG
nr:DEAD-box ATP-dependent RNA helicase 37-like [Tanacetum cinerariifolium]